MGLEPTTLYTLDRALYHWATKAAQLAGPKISLFIVHLINRHVHVRCTIHDIVCTCTCVYIVYVPVYILGLYGSCVFESVPKTFNSVESYPLSHTHTHSGGGAGGNRSLPWPVSRQTPAGTGTGTSTGSGETSGEGGGERGKVGGKCLLWQYMLCPCVAYNHCTKCYMISLGIVCGVQFNPTFTCYYWPEWNSLDSTQL